MFILPITVLDNRDNIQKWCRFALKNHVYTVNLKITKNSIDNNLFILEFPTLKKLIFKGEIDEDERRVLLLSMKPDDVITKQLRVVDLANVGVICDTFAINVEEIDF